MIKIEKSVHQSFSLLNKHWEAQYVTLVLLLLFPDQGEKEDARRWGIEVIMKCSGFIPGPVARNYLLSQPFSSTGYPALPIFNEKARKILFFYLCDHADVWGDIFDGLQSPIS